MILSGQARKWMRVSPGVVSLVSPSEVSDDGSLGADVWPDDSSSDAEPPAVDHSPDRAGRAEHAVHQQRRDDDDQQRR